MPRPDGDDTDGSPESGGRELAEVLAAETNRSPDAIRATAEEMDVEAPGEADWQPLDGDWEESPAYQEY